jgi:hypothetical protein
MRASPEHRGIFSETNPVSEAKTERFAALLATLTNQANQLPANANNHEIQICLRCAIGTFVMQGEICSKVLAIGRRTNRSFESNAAYGQSSGSSGSRPS